MAGRELSRDEQARRLRGWMLGLHATHMVDVGGRLGYFAELRRRGAATAEELASALGLDPRCTRVWCQAACSIGILVYREGQGFAFAPFMEELLGEGSPELLTAHVLASLSRDFTAYPQAFRTGRSKTFQDHDPDFFFQQSRLSALRAPQVVAAARSLPQVEKRLEAGGWVLDVGSGSGTVLVSFAEAFPTCRGVGVEPLPYFVQSSRRLIQERALEGRVRVEAIRAEEMDFHEAFDLTTMVQVFHELPDPAKPDILSRCWQGLKPGGVLLLMDRCVPEKDSEISDRRFTMSILEQWMEVTWGNVVHTRTEILAMLKKAGFELMGEDERLIPTYWTFMAKRPEP